MGARKSPLIWGAARQKRSILSPNWLKFRIFTVFAPCDAHAGWLADPCGEWRVGRGDIVAQHRHGTHGQSHVIYACMCTSVLGIVFGSAARVGTPIAVCRSSVSSVSSC